MDTLDNTYVLPLSDRELLAVALADEPSATAQAIHTNGPWPGAAQAIHTNGPWPGAAQAAPASRR